MTGNRADYGLLEPLIKACQNVFNVRLFVTGSHLSPQFGETWKNIDDSLAYLPCEFVHVLIDSDAPVATTLSQSLSLSQFATKFADVDLLVVLGDRFEILPPVLAAYNVGVPVVHIQGSDTTKGSLDEGYRGCIRSLATHHFTVELYGSLGCVFPELKGFNKYEVIVVYHPYKDWYEQEYKNIIEACKDYCCLILSGNADAGGRWVLSTSKHYNQISLPRAEYLSYLAGAKFIIGNSSSGIIEAPSLEVPTVNVGNRQMGRRKARSVIQSCGTLESLRGSIEIALNNRWANDMFDNPYHNPNTLELMVNKLKEILN